jgi:NADH-quinone oxidoreductase E subunit
MSQRSLAAEQPASFAFTPDNAARAQRIIAKYPAGRQASAVIPVLDIVQRQEGWVSKPAMEAVAKLLEMAPIRVLEVATFYTMFHLAPVGKYHVQICTNLSCWLRGSDDVVRACKDKLGVGLGGSTADGLFSVEEVECAGACVNAPVVAVNDDYYEDLDAAGMGSLLDALKRGAKPPIGSVKARQGSAPAGASTSLTGDPTQPVPKQDLAAAKPAYETAKAEAAAKAAQPKS